jgi:hypothetical protein
VVGLQQFDEMVLLLMQQHGQIGPWTRAHTMTPLQQAACQLAPQASSLLLGIRELIRQAYLMPAAALVRRAFERIATLSWRCENPSQVQRWHDGWKHSSRPPLSERMTAMLGADPPEETMRRAKAVIDEFNGFVHGDPVAANMGAVLLGGGGVGFTVSKDLGSPTRASVLAQQGALYTVVLSSRCVQLFPEALA